MYEWVFSTKYKERMGILSVIIHTDIFVCVSRFACKVSPEMLRHMTMKLKILTVSN
jgi:hypothetical protein